MDSWERHFRLIKSSLVQFPGIFRCRLIENKPLLKLKSIKKTRVQWTSPKRRFLRTALSYIKSCVLESPLNILPRLSASQVLLTWPPFLLAGAIFREDQRNTHYDLAFKFAVHKINKDQHILPKTTLIYDIQYVKTGDSFHANKQGNLVHPWFPEIDATRLADPFSPIFPNFAF